MGLSLAETLFTAVVLAIVLGILVFISQNVRKRGEIEETEYRLSALNSALKVFYEKPNAMLPADTSNVLIQLLDEPSSAKLLKDIPINVVSEGDTGRQRVEILDGFDNPIRYITPEQRGNEIGDFVSAGADRMFGDSTNQTQHGSKQSVDNMFGSETETKME
ncbi:hypothetical protein [Poriferisphaera corsica]|nr:hypothetical protein [Poriferisphaera corsica]